MTDLRTIEEVAVGPYTVRVAEELDDDGYTAAVIKYKDYSRDAPLVSQQRKYLAVGLAVDAYQNDEDDEDGEGE